MFSELDKTFDIVPETTTTEAPIETSTDLVPVLTKEEKVDEDMEKARITFHELLTKGSLAMDGILNIAQASEHPRAYEVAAQMLKTMSEVTKDLVALQKSKKELEKVAPAIGKQQNNYFIGSTNELLKQIAEQAKIASAEIVQTENDK